MEMKPKKGHWKKGRRRNVADDARDVRALIVAAKKLLRRRATGSDGRYLPVEQRVSRKAFAEVVGVSLRTISRWLSGEDWPDPDSAAKLRAHIDTLSAAIDHSQK